MLTQCIPLLVNELSALGCKNRSIIAKIIGGACMFEYFGTNLNIGERNAEKVRILLKEHHIALAAEDVGGKVGRSVTFLPGKRGEGVHPQGRRVFNRSLRNAG